MRMLIPVAVLAAAVSSVEAAAIDFATHAGMEATCAAQARAGSGKRARDEERVAFAICESLSLARDAAAWVARDAQRLRLDDPAERTRVRARLEGYLVRVAAVRVALESVKARKPLFVIEPGNWAVDFDGDGQVSPAERHFFRTPKRGVAMRPMDIAVDEAQLLERYASPVILVDQSDVHWALAYCNFVEAAMHLVLAYDLTGQGLESLVLVDGARVRKLAYGRLVEGIRQSALLRQALLRETDDDREWIANPRQSNTSFPLVMDETTFATWGTLLDEVQRLLAGKALLGGQVDTGGLRGLADLSLGLCKPGEGLDVRSLFLDPLPRAMDHAALASRCAAPTKARPLSGLAALASASLKRNAARAPGEDSGEWTVIRHLYWVN